MYKLNKNSILRLSDNASIPFDPANTDFAAYTLWLSEGNTPAPADIPTPPSYRELRAPLYPPVTDGLDAMVKGGQAWGDYKAACMAVKALVPKS